MADINKQGWPDKIWDLINAVSHETWEVARKIGMTISIWFINYKIVKTFKIWDQTYAEVENESWEKSILIFKGWNFTDFTNGASAVTVHSISDDGTKVEIKKDSLVFYSHKNGNITIPKEMKPLEKE